jgi:hypothetical protein
MLSPVRKTTPIGGLTADIAELLSTNAGDMVAAVSQFDFAPTRSVRADLVMLASLQFREGIHVIRVDSAFVP